MATGRTLLLYWGQTGAGPRLLLELSRTLADMIGPENLAISFNEASATARELLEVGAKTHIVRTYHRTRKSFLLNTVRIPLIRRDFRDFIRESAITSVYSVMDTPYQIPALYPLHTNPFRYVSTVHDAVPHEGDNALLGNTNLKLTLRSADHIITLSEHVASILAEVHSLTADDMTVLFHPAWESPMMTARNGVPRGRTVRVGFFGRLLPYKGVHLMLDALRTLKQEGYDVEAIIHGSGPEARLTTEYRDIAPNWQPRWIDDAEIPGLLADLDLLVLPYIEASQSGVMAYALSAGLPVLGTPTGGLMEQIQKSQSGMISEAVSADALAAGLRTLLNNDELYRQLSLNSLQSAQTTFSWKSFAERLLPVLEPQ